MPELIWAHRSTFFLRVPEWIHHRCWSTRLRSCAGEVLATAARSPKATQYPERHILVPARWGSGLHFQIGSAVGCWPLRSSYPEQEDPPPNCRLAHSPYLTPMDFYLVGIWNLRWEERWPRVSLCSRERQRGRPCALYGQCTRASGWSAKWKLGPSFAWAEKGAMSKTGCRVRPTPLMTVWTVWNKTSGSRDIAIHSKTIFFTFYLSWVYDNRAAISWHIFANTLCVKK